MKVALVASSYSPQRGGLQRHVEELARGLATRGAQVEVLVAGAPRDAAPVAEREGVVIRRFPLLPGQTRLSAAPGFWERLRTAAATFDLADAHSAGATLALAVARAGFGRMVFTPHAPVQRLTRWPSARATRAVIGDAAWIVCRSDSEADLLRAKFPSAAHRIGVVSSGVDARAIGAARPFPEAGGIVLTVGRLERYRRVDRAIAAMASLDPAYRLVVVGDGPLRHRLHAYAADLQVSRIVRFAGPVTDPELYSWLRTAQVVLALAEHEDSGLRVLEALTAGAVVVASDIPVHREAASQVDGAVVIFVSPEGSPLDVADAISEAARIGVRAPTAGPEALVPSWNSAVASTFEIYRAVIAKRRPAIAQRDEALVVPPRSAIGGQAVEVDDLPVHG